MKVKDLIKELSKYPGNKEVYVVKNNGDGCETCGYGATIDENKYFDIEDMETKIWIK